MKYLDHLFVHSGFINDEANIYSYVNEGVEYLFIENDTYFNRDGVYGYADDAARFSFYNVAVVAMMIKMDYYPDICHEHDYQSITWHTRANTTNRCSLIIWHLIIAITRTAIFVSMITATS